MFGGSAMWGTGARDPFTIPALLARELVKRGVEARVTNFGETGYVSTQEIIELLLQLQRGNVPDLVIFYDGANDAFSAYQQGSAGLPMNEIHRVAEFNLTNRRMVKDLIRTAATATIDRLSTVRFVQGVLGRLLGSRAVNPPIGTSASGRGDPASLAEQVMRVHAANMDVAGALSATYGFKCLSYWQPTIFGKRELSKYEEGERQRGEQKTDGVVEATYSLAHEIQTESCGKEPLHDLSAVFTSVQEPMFIDWVHLDERGNRIIAERMVEDVLGVLHASIAEGSTTRTSGHAR
jgi:lysophospholipase L1-like esterase